MNEQRIEIVFAGPLWIMEVSEPPKIHALLTIKYGDFIIRADGDKVMYTLPVDKMTSMQVSYVDAQNNPAEIDGEVVWASSDDDILVVTTDPADSTICSVTPGGQVGQAQVTATADADLGQGTRQLITVCDIEVVAGEAVAGSIQPLGEPQPIAPHPEQEA
ncbi:hypothetical protein ACVMGC_001012 [Bradyrhizobium barranii subsp. barranii]|uniref:hypothetical protein n=1 Tax=Bradyrhizobium TaxID=374 RepID=UPI001BA5C331|nr:MULTISPECIES: hypothetical protein [Bradyrhizobium]MBR0879614.1 hypothetical protein [Bradyrhizobium liaoningense]MCP1778834.1 hypothetical protein [Bradyrhizobium japonicum]MCP1958168.1 hypothetical protein [Bradyrhizobium japonicum]